MEWNRYIMIIYTNTREMKEKDAIQRLKEICKEKDLNIFMENVSVKSEWNNIYINNLSK